MLHDELYKIGANRNYIFVYNICIYKYGSKACFTYRHYFVYQWNGEKKGSVFYKFVELLQPTGEIRKEAFKKGRSANQRSPRGDAPG